VRRKQPVGFQARQAAKAKPLAEIPRKSAAIVLLFVITQFSEQRFCTSS
jgi:hypothetical protein